MFSTRLFVEDRSRGQTRQQAREGASADKPHLAESDRWVGWTWAPVSHRLWLSTETATQRRMCRPKQPGPIAALCETVHPVFYRRGACSLTFASCRYSPHPVVSGELALMWKVLKIKIFMPGKGENHPICGGPRGKPLFQIFNPVDTMHHMMSCGSFNWTQHKRNFLL